MTRAAVTQTFSPNFTAGFGAFHSTDGPEAQSCLTQSPVAILAPPSAYGTGSQEPRLPSYPPLCPGQALFLSDIQLPTLGVGIRTPDQPLIPLTESLPRPVKTGP